MLLLLLGICSLLWTVAPGWAQGERQATLISAQRATITRRTGAAEDAVRTMRLAPGDTLRTGAAGQATLLFPDGSQVKLNRNSTLRIPDAAPAGDLPPRLDLLAGELFARISPGRRLSIETPAAVAGVRGTELNLALTEEGAATLTVGEGEVSFTNPQGSVSVREGQQSVARPGQAPSAPVAVNVPFIIEWTNDLQPVALLLEQTFVSQAPARLAAAQQEAEALPPGAERERRLGDVRHDRGEPREALAAYEAALQALGPAAPAAERAALEARHGQTRLELGQVPEAEAAFRRSLALEPAAASPQAGLVMALLSRRENAAALAAAQAAVGAPLVGAPGDPEGRPVAVTQTALALAQLRSGERDAAQQSLARAAAADPTYAPAHAWRSFLLRAAERLDEAQVAARQAVSLAPYSSLARQSLADALFAQGRTQEAGREAQQAVRLNPLSPGAHVSLGRALLQAARIAPALRAANAAVALDPELERARFFRGVVLAQQRRLAAAERELERAVALDPGYLEARAFLARVYLEQGRRSEAVQVAQAAIERDPAFAPARGALGRVYWRAGRLPEAAAEYRRALELSPGSLLYHLELARVYLDQNNLPDALTHASSAAAAAPGSSEARAVLGLVYDRRGSPEQALREYRAALSLSPENALARLGLGTSSPASGERVREIRRVLSGGPAVSLSQADTGESLREVAQAMLRDPSVLMQIFRPGVTTELAPGGGADETTAIGGTHRDEYLRGRLFDLSLGSREESENYRNGRPEERAFGWLNLASAPGYRTHVLGQYVYTGREKALPGSTFSPTPNGQSSFWENSWDLTTRHQVEPNTFLWLHARNQRSSSVNRDPDTVQGPFAPLNATMVYSRAWQRRMAVEGRLDRSWGGNHTSSYVLFAGRNLVDYRQLGYSQPSRAFDEMTDLFIRDRLVSHTLQHDYRPSRRLSLILGAGVQRYTDRYRAQDPGEVTVQGPETSETDWLPFGQATYVLTRRDLVRVIAHRREERGFSPLLQPGEAFLVDEFPALEEGGESTSYELDYERTLSRRAFAKLFLFRGDLKNFLAAPTVTQTANPFLLEDDAGSQFYSLGFIVPEARSQGIGMRYEYQLGPFLTSFLRYTYREFTDETACSPDERQRGICMPPGRQLPMQPRSSAVLGLNYVDRAGTKLFAEVVWRGRMVEGVTRRAQWEELPSRLILNLRLGRERSVRREWTLSIGNLFNTATTYWPGFPAPGRTFRLQYSLRF